MYNKSLQKTLFDLSKEFLQKDMSNNEYQDLVNVLNFHEWKYYVDNDPLISDKEYDTLYEKLVALENQNEVAVLPNSPSQRVSSDLSSQFETVTHWNPMLSLANSYNLEDLGEFDKQIRKLTNLEDKKIAYFVEPKLDGGSVSLVYENDILVRSATRGNGNEGENITANAKAISSVPLSAKFSDHGIFRAELRGEAVIEKSFFTRKNKEREKEGLVVFANPRNAATGGLRMKNPNDTKERGLDLFVFQLAYAVDKNGEDVLSSLESHSNAMIILESLGFKIPKKENQLTDTIEAAFELCKDWEINRENYNYEIDGAVVKVNDFDLQKKCGSTQHHPRWAIAFKFKAKQATTTLSDIEYQVGKTGAITPVAKVDPVHLAGVTVSSISLHNEEFIMQKDLRLGDKVLIERAGDVIPYIVKSFPELRDGSQKKIDFPKHCPSCNTTLEKSDDQAAWRCQNLQCDAQNLQRIIYHVSKEAMNIDGFGKSYVEKFFDLGWIKDISDVYNLDYEKIGELEGFGQKSVDNLKSAIEKAKGNPLNKLLNSLSIHHLGKKASKLIAQQINSVFDLVEWTEENFTEIKDIGPVVAENVMWYFNQESNIDMLNRLNEYGVNVLQLEADKPKVVKEGAVLSGKTILFTGTLQKMGRKEAQSLAEENGARNISAVSSKLNILVVGEKAGSKLKKAQALGTVDILTEDEFITLIS
ncbi:MAG: NAD-dependent DNA ligase LigA [Saprospiraceae bacterium]|nr:NAD-dependent DNA ligase LigA [Bacteroidia bacterium]NNE14151.1 NAD-dependent DNA ligase LigA [Saprospiraceae bacterium]